MFLVDTYDVKILRDNGKRIKSLFKQIIILDSVEYHVIAYYLKPYENHFVIIFQSQLSSENIKLDGWYLYYELVDVVFENIGDKSKVLDEFGIHVIIYK